MIVSAEADVARFHVACGLNSTFDFCGRAAATTTRHTAFVRERTLHGQIARGFGFGAVNRDFATCFNQHITRRVHHHSAGCAVVFDARAVSKLFAPNVAARCGRRVGSVVNRAEHHAAFATCIEHTNHLLTRIGQCIKAVATCVGHHDGEPVGQHVFERRQAYPNRVLGVVAFGDDADL